MNFCRFSNVVGEPGKGFHSSRLFGFALNDSIGTLVLAALFQWTLRRYTRKYWSYSKCLLVVFLVGIACHSVFCVRTTFGQNVMVLNTKTMFKKSGGRVWII